MRKLAALRPGYFRVPGGNYLEGDTIDTRFNWEQTVGPIQDRPGHFNSAWGYWSQDGMGLLEYLELAEQLHAQPLLAVWTGYTLTGTVVAQSQLAPYVQQAVDEIQYATGSTSTYWGRQRALDGHPAPFDVRMVEVGNEDFFDTSGGYNAYRYPMFATAIKAADPQLKIVATTPVTNGPHPTSSTSTTTTTIPPTSRPTRTCSTPSAAPGRRSSSASTRRRRARRRGHWPTRSASRPSSPVWNVTPIW